MKKIFIAMLAFCLALTPLIFVTGCEKNNSYLYSVYNESKVDFAKFENLNSNATAQALSNQQTSYAMEEAINIHAAASGELGYEAVSESKAGYESYGIVSYYSGEALKTFLYEENNPIKNVVKFNTSKDDPEYNNLLWKNDAEKISGIITLDLNGNDSKKVRTVIGVQFSNKPSFIGNYGIIYRKDINTDSKYPQLLAEIVRVYDGLFNGIQNASITQSQDNELVYYLNFVPVKEIIDKGVYANSTGYYSADKKTFLKVNGIYSKVEIEEGCEVILSEAFIRPTLYSSINPNTVLKEVVLPNSVKRIEKYAFGGCIMLEKINKPTSLEYLDDNWLEDVGLYSLESAYNYYGKPAETHHFDFEI